MYISKRTLSWNLIPRRLFARKAGKRITGIEKLKQIKKQKVEKKQEFDNLGNNNDKYTNIMC